MSKRCLVCQSEFKPWGRRTFCSQKCLNIYRKDYRKKNALEIYSGTPKKFIRYLCAKGVHTLSQDFLYSLYEKQNGLCALSKIPMTFIHGIGRTRTNLSVDRIDSSKEYTEDNVQLVCGIVNIMKGNMTIIELKYWCEKICQEN